MSSSTHINAFFHALQKKKYHTAGTKCIILCTVAIPILTIKYCANLPHILLKLKCLYLHVKISIGKAILNKTAAKKKLAIVF